MRVIAVGDQPFLGTLTRCIRRARPASEILAFLGGRPLLEWLEKGAGFDAAFLDMELSDMSSIVLARRLKQLAPRGNLILMTESADYMAEALALRVSGYLRKPVTENAVREELANLRHPISDPAARRIRIQTFGNFEIFCDGRPIHFSRRRTKELLAYLVDRRGAGSSMGELRAILWEGRPDSESVRSQLRSLITDLRTTLRNLGQEDIVIKRRDSIALDPEKVDCDYYRYLEGDPAAAKAFRGEYMANYSWAEPTLGGLSSKRPKKV